MDIQNCANLGYFNLALHFIARFSRQVVELAWYQVVLFNFGFSTDRLWFEEGMDEHRSLCLVSTVPPFMQEIKDMLSILGCTFWRKSAVQ